MYIEHKHNLDKDTARRRLDEYIEKMVNIKLPGNFKIIDFKKSWTGDEMQFGFEIKSSILKRRVSGVAQVDDNKVILEAELPTLIKNFITDENLENMVRQQIDTALS